MRNGSAAGWKVLWVFLGQDGDQNCWWITR